MKYEALDTKAKDIACRFQACEKELLKVIIELDRKKAFRYWGYNSLFAYATQRLGLSPSVTLNYTAVARKSHEVPELKSQVLAGKISIHQARKITPVLNKANQKLWMEKARTQSQKQLERDVALAQPKTAVMEKSAYVSCHQEIKEQVKILQKVPRIQLQMGVSEKTMIQLRRAQDLESQRTKGNASLEDTLNVLLETYLQKNDPIEKAKRQKIRGKLQGKVEKNTQENFEIKRCREKQIWKEPTSKRNVRRMSQTDVLSKNVVISKSCHLRESKNHRPSLRKSIPARIRHQVQLRDEGRCSYKDPRGRRCGSQRYLEMHHIKEVATGGENSLENLTLLCSGHHKAHHVTEPRT